MLLSLVSHLSLISFLRFFQNLQIISFFDHAAVQHLRKYALARHDAIAHCLEDRASMVAFFSDLCQFQHDIVAFKFCPDRERLEIDSFHDQIFTERAVLDLRPPRAEFLNPVI